MAQPIVRPDLVENKYLEYLDNLNEHGKDLFEMRLYLASEYALHTDFAAQVVSYWAKLRGIAENAN